MTTPGTNPAIPTATATAIATDATARAVRLQQQVAGICLIVGALLMPLNTFFEYRNGMLFWAGLAYMLLVPGLLGLASLLRQRAPRLSVFGGLLVTIGTIGGMNFSTVLLFEWAEREAGTPAATLAAIAAVVEGRVLPVLVIFSILCPIALLIVAVGLVRTAVAPAWVAVLLGLGAVLFPVGHIAANEPVTHLAELFLLIASI